MADPAPSRQGPVALPAGGSPRSISGAARRRPAAGRDRPADICRARGAVARRRPGARRPHQARGGARAGGLFRYVRAAARLYPSAALSAVRRAGAGHRRDAGGDRPRHRAACARAGLVAAGRALGAARDRGRVGCRGGAGPRAGAGPRGEAPAAPRSDRRAVRRCGAARAVRDPARLRDYRAGRTRGAASPPRAARRGGRACDHCGPRAVDRRCGDRAGGRRGRRAAGPGAVRIVLRRAPGLAANPRRPAAGIRRLCGSRAPPPDGSMSPGGAPIRCAPSLRC